MNLGYKTRLALGTGLVGALAIAAGYRGYVDSQEHRSDNARKARIESVRKNLLSSQSLGPIHSDSSEPQELNPGEIAYLNGRNYEATVKSEKNKNIVVILNASNSNPESNTYHRSFTDYVKSSEQELKSHGVNVLIVDRNLDLRTFDEIYSKTSTIPITFLYQDGKIINIVYGNKVEEVKETIRTSFN